MYSLKKIHSIGAGFTLISGCLLHFAWEWSGQSNIAAIFCPVSESVWEHLKLLFFPFLSFSALEYFLYGKDIVGFLRIKTFAVLLGMFTVVSAFYTYTGIIGRNFLPLDIGTFLAGTVISYLYSYKNLSAHKAVCSVFTQTACIILLLGLAIAFAVFSFTPPEFGMFLPPNI